MRRFLCLLVPLALVAARAQPALAWSSTGHRLIGVIGARTLPPELPAFLYQPETIWRLGELAREPDRSKGTGNPHDADLDSGHFLDVDDNGRALGGPTLAELPANREAYERALQAAGTNSWKAGWQLWLDRRLIDKKDFAYWRVDAVGEKHGKTKAERAWFARDRRLREQITIRDLGYWSHFIGDGSQPLHMTLHYNGWGNGPNPKNYTKERIHEPFEGAFVHDNITEADIVTALPPPAPCGCTIQQAMQQYLAVTAAKMEPLYQLWGEGAFKGADPRGKAFAVERVAAAAAELRDLVTQAWQASGAMTVGYPAVSARSVEDSGVAPYINIYGDD